MARDLGVSKNISNSKTSAEKLFKLLQASEEHYGNKIRVEHACSQQIAEMDFANEILC